MILQALNDYYHRNESLPKEGWLRRGVDYAIVLDTSGTCVAITDALGTVNKGKVTPYEALLPAVGKQAMKHANSGSDANFLWDNASFVFGRGNKGDQKLASFLDAINYWAGDLADEGLVAVKQFCQAIQQDTSLVLELFKRFQVEADFEKRDPVVIFRLHPDIEGVHAREAVRIAYESKLAEVGAGAVLRGNCLITGAISTPIASNETVIKGVWGAQTSGANIVSFNARAFESYGKKDRNGENAPVSVRASFAYTTALNHLLRKDSPQRIQIGDASTVFWMDKDSELEAMMGNLFKDDPDENKAAVEALLSAVHKEHGTATDEELDNNRFHILGLAPNAARISIRFYYCLTLPELARRIEQHFTDLKMVRGSHGHDPEYPSIFRLLTAVVLQNKADNIPPNLGGSIVDAIFAGENVPYPAQWLNMAVGRCRAEQNVTYLRAAAIKACLNRKIRHTSSTERKFEAMLDLNNQNPGYRMGRLFAVLEKIQEEASPGLNATIRDRYYGAASSTPVAVFTALLRLKNAHLKKLQTGRGMYFEKLLGEILETVTDFPKHLPLPEQGRFALGYYHQRQDFFTKKSD